MPFREKVRRALGRGSSASGTPSEDTNNSKALNSQTSNPTSDSPTSSNTSELKKTSTANSSSTISRIRSRISTRKEKDDPYKDWPEHIYKPHEMPRPKYRRPVDPKHAAHLDSFSFEKAFQSMRRRSGLSQYSPMGSRLPSRIGSISSSKTGKGMQSTIASRNQSIAEVLTEGEQSDGKSPRFLSGME
jgi:hypothetical protein